MDPVLGIDFWVLFIIKWASVPVGLYAFVHAVTQRSDAYSAANKMTKQAWAAITAGGTFALFIGDPYGFSFLLWMIGLVAVLVYLVDVRPRLIEVQRGPRW